MKKIGKFILIIIVALTAFSCLKEFSPKAEFKEKYILNCILKSDTAFQVATVSHSFDVNGYDPSVNKVDPTIKNADIRLWYGDDIYVFNDSTTAVTGSRYGDSVTFYYINNFMPKINKSVEIEALLPNGLRLKSTTVLPDEIKFNVFESDRSIPPLNKDGIIVKWRYEDGNPIFAPRFTLVYRKLENGINVRHVVDVPSKYVNQNGSFVPVFPVPSKQNYVEADMDAITRLMEHISEGDPVKENYTILSVVLWVYIFDQNLSNYYSSSSQGIGDILVMLDQNDFSNIENGYGIFGSYSIQGYSLLISKEYIESFGYIAGLNN